MPLLLIYFAYGALGIIDVTPRLLGEGELTLSAAELAGIGVWLTLPWTIKMVFGQLVDSVPFFGSQRRSYILIGAAFTAAGMLIARGRGERLARLPRPRNELYVLGALLIVIGTVIQDVVADAMSTEVVPRIDEAGKPRPEHDMPRRSRHGAGAGTARRCRSAFSRSPARRAGLRVFSTARPCS